MTKTSQLIILLFLSLTFNSYAQKRSAIKLYDEAQLSLDVQEQEHLYQQSIAKDSSFVDAYIKLSQHYQQQGKPTLQVKTLEAAARQSTPEQELILAQLSRAAYLAGYYTKANRAISQLDCSTDPFLRYYESCIAFACDACTHAVHFDPQNMGENVNTPYNDYWPSLSLDEEQMVTTVLVDQGEDQFYGGGQEDFYSSTLVDGTWREASPLSTSINSGKNEGAQCLSADGRVMLFTACDRGNSYGSCDIYITHKEDGQWTSAIPLPKPINSSHWDGHPSLSADGRTLYFSSDRPGGAGAKDIYKADISLTPHVTVTDVINVGETINTAKDEVSPFIHPDNSSLYFSSDGHVGLGRQDIYMTHCDSVTFTNEVINLGYPINTHHDEIGLVINAKGNTAYFATERQDSHQKDIYSFEVPTNVRPEEVTYVKANIRDGESKELIQANVEINTIDERRSLVNLHATDAFITPLPSGKRYAINVYKEGYLFYSNHFSLIDNNDLEYEKDIYLKRIEKGQTIVLKNVLFEHNSYILDREYTNELNSAATLITQNPNIQFEVSGHTDHSGTAQLNQKLSEQRAHAVYQFLLELGVSPEQLSYKGYGATQAISDIDEENRRTELLIK